MPTEVKGFEKKARSRGWDQFIFSHKTQLRVADFIRQYVEKKFP